MTPLLSWPLPPPSLTLTNPLSQALEFIVDQTAAPQWPDVAAPPQGPPQPLFSVGIVNLSLPLKHFLLPACYDSFICYLCCSFSFSNYQGTRPPSLCRFCSLLRDLSILVFNNHSYVHISQIITLLQILSLALSCISN